MTLTTFAPVAHEANARQVPVRRPSQFIGLLELANQLRADEQLQRALQAPGTALLGLAADGVPLLIRLASPDVTHVLISGPNASGKTRVLATMLASLVLFQKPREIQLFVLSSQPEAFQFLAALPHLNSGIAHTAEHARQQLRWLEAEMERRTFERVTRPRLIAAVDVLAEENKDSRREFAVRLGRLAQSGRAAGISLLLCQREGDTAGVNAMLSQNFPVRLVAHQAERARGTLTMGGVFDLFAGGERVRFQAAVLPSAALPAFYAQVEANLKPRHAGAPDLRALLKRLTRGQ